MLLTYTSLVDVVIRNDYYLPDIAKPNEWPADEDIHQDLHIRPSRETKKLFDNFRIKFRPSRTGFRLFIQTSGIKTFLPVSSNNRWTFFLELNNKAWKNFSNDRLINNRKNLFYFNNLSATRITDATATPPVDDHYLGNALPDFGTAYPGETRYALGDLVRRPAAGNIFQAVANAINPATPFIATQWIDSGFKNLHYVNPGDQVRLQNNVYTYHRSNTTPGETIVFVLKDIKGNAVPLGEIAGTGLSQGSFTTSANPLEPVHHTLFFDHLTCGKYTLSIASGAADPDESFYYMHPLRDGQAYAVIELFAASPLPDFAFLDHTTPAPDTLFLSKKFHIRFKNRLTRWEYLRQDQTQELITAYRPLRRVFSGNTTRPDPGVQLIYPTVSANGVDEITSKIYLSK